MTRSGSSFSQQVAVFARKAQGRADLAVRKITKAVLTDIVMASPVGNPELWAEGSRPEPGYVGGQFRGNWQVSVGAPAVGTIDNIDPEGSSTIAAGRAVILSATLGDTIYITNNLPYARRIEYGWSRQAPAGVVRITVARYSQIVSDAVAEARGEMP